MKKNYFFSFLFCFFFTPSSHTMTIPSVVGLENYIPPNPTILLPTDSSNKYDKNEEDEEEDFSEEDFSYVSYPTFSFISQEFLKENPEKARQKIEQNIRDSLIIADRGYVLEEGKIIIEGKGRELLANDHIKEVYLGI